MVGASVNRIAKKQNKQVGNIGMVAVLPEYRGRGIGRELCERSLKVFRDFGIKEVYLETEVHNYTSLALYEVCLFHYILPFYTFLDTSL